MSSIDYNPFDYDIDIRAHDVWRRMRDEAPLYHNDEHNFWALTRYDDVLTGLLDVETYSSRYATSLDLMGDEGWTARAISHAGTQGVGSEGPRGRR